VQKAACQGAVVYNILILLYKTTIYFGCNGILREVNGRGMSALSVAARRDGAGHVRPDLRKTQSEDKFLLLQFCRIFFNFFQKKFWLMSNIQILKFSPLHNI